jgi:hypothetical protein
MSDVPNLQNLQNLDIKTKGSTSPLDGSAIPGFLPTSKALSNLEKYRVRYQKLDMDDLGDISELEKIETRAIHNAGVYILSKKDFTFMDKMFVLISYLEETKD